MKKLIVLNNNFDTSKDVVVYGTGQIALLTHSVLLEEGVGIKAFCGADTTIKIMGKPVISKQELKRAKDKVTVVYADQNLLNAKKDMKNLGISDYWVDDRIYSIVNDCVWTFM